MNTEKNSNPAPAKPETPKAETPKAEAPKQENRKAAAPKVSDQTAREMKRGAEKIALRV